MHNPLPLQGILETRKMRFQKNDLATTNILGNNAENTKTLHMHKIPKSEKNSGRTTWRRKNYFQFAPSLPIKNNIKITPWSWKWIAGRLIHPTVRELRCIGSLSRCSWLHSCKQNARRTIRATVWERRWIGSKRRNTLLSCFFPEAITSRKYSKKTLRRTTASRNGIE